MSVYKLYTSAKNIIYCFNLGLTVFCANVHRIRLVSISFLCTVQSSEYVFSRSLWLCIDCSRLSGNCYSIVLQMATKQSAGFVSVGFWKSILFQWCRIYMLLTTINDQTIKGNSMVTVCIRQLFCSIVLASRTSFACWIHTNLQGVIGKLLKFLLVQ